MKYLLLSLSILLGITGFNHINTYISPDMQIITTWQSAAIKGDAHAQLALGWAYANGMGVDQDYTLAMKWWSEAANQNNAKAQLMMGIMYSECNDIKKDYQLAEKWFRCAAENGNLNAMRRLNIHSHLIPLSKQVNRSTTPVCSTTIPGLLSKKQTDNGPYLTYGE
ncbi:tetratricopeptide repeat protein [Prosthecochloris sp. CIB 2401]|uniref:tetratricopeptide repeat protein n=1 Tax=Prosthecochloris sp. CIB 2401 TaxID=1868325 RepID=UPI00080A9DE1|nr:tetratricopeptide repeat protein [Prosthecochloris sp. CIB 2401]ANT64768.1 Sel1 repeat protein [Prosthecochloris sp. CIB 2401]